VAATNKSVKRFFSPGAALIGNQAAQRGTSILLAGALEAVYDRLRLRIDENKGSESNRSRLRPVEALIHLLFHHTRSTAVDIAAAVVYGG